MPPLFFTILPRKLELKFKPLLFLPGIALFLVTTILLVIPGNKFPKTDIISVDKIIHSGLFFVLTLLFCWPFKYSDHSTVQKRSWFLSITLYAIAYGILMEFVQKYFVINRSYDVMDMAFDAVGSLIGYSFSLRFFAKK